MSEALEWTDVHAVAKRLLRTDITAEESQNYYRQWAEVGTYDELVGKNINYGALDRLKSALKELSLQTEKVLVLDVGAGTGLTGKQLLDLGFSNIHALEPNSGFVEILKQNGIYKNIIGHFLGGDTPLDVSEDTYDLIVSAGAFGPGHIPCSAIQEMIRIVKPGGYIVNCMREEYFETVPEYKGKLKPLLHQMEIEGRWKKIRWDIYPNHFGDNNGVVMVYQVC